MRTLYGQRWFRPMEIAELGLIQSSKGDSGSIAGHYSYVIGLIKSGRIRAKNYSKGAKPYYLIPEREIERYHLTVNKVSKEGKPKNVAQQD